MRKRTIATLPPIAINERPEKLALTVSKDLRESMESFSEFFTSTTGSTPTSLNAVIVGILTAYIDQHSGYQKWLKSKPRHVTSDARITL
jgi:hypothetical protein